MSLSAILALALAPASPLAPDHERIVVAAAPSTPAAAASTEIEIDRDPGKLFAHHDSNDSGFLENPESPFVAIAFTDDTGPEPRDGEAVINAGANPDQVAAFYETADTDGDGRVSLAEFTGWSTARRAEMGIEVKTILKVLPAPQS